MVDQKIGDGESLDGLGEDRLVGHLGGGHMVGRDVILGTGDDCAILRGRRPGWWQLFKTDLVAEGSHFLAGDEAYWVGWKAMGRVVSDVAAMGGLPTEALVTWVVPGATPFGRVRGIDEGLRAACGAYGVSVVGGETSRAQEGGGILLMVSILGEVEEGRALRRDGGRAGDLLYVTGELGGAVVGGGHLRFRARLGEGRWLAGRDEGEGRPSAMMDLSDGLGQDLPRLARASGVSYEIEPGLLPCAPGCGAEEACGEGEDYELLLAVPAREAGELERAWVERWPELRLTRIGRLASEGEGHRAGEGKGLAVGGWDPFRGG